MKFSTAISLSIIAVSLAACSAPRNKAKSTQPRYEAKNTQAFNQGAFNKLRVPGRVSRTVPIKTPSRVQINGVTVHLGATRNMVSNGYMKGKTVFWEDYNRQFSGSNGLEVITTYRDVNQMLSNLRASVQTRAPNNTLTLRNRRINPNTNASYRNALRELYGRLTRK